MHYEIRGSDSTASANVVNVDDAQVAYRVHGKGPAVVLVNGTGALDVHWGHVIEVLKQPENRNQSRLLRIRRYGR